MKPGAVDRLRAACVGAGEHAQAHLERVAAVVADALRNDDRAAVEVARHREETDDE